MTIWEVGLSAQSWSTWKLGILTQTMYLLCILYLLPPTIPIQMYLSPKPVVYTQCFALQEHESRVYFENGHCVRGFSQVKLPERMNHILWVLDIAHLGTKNNIACCDYLCSFGCKMRRLGSTVRYPRHMSPCVVEEIYAYPNHSIDWKNRTFPYHKATRLVRETQDS